MEAQLDDLQFLRGVRERLRTYGWQGRSCGSMEGPNCLMGAAYVVSGIATRDDIPLSQTLKGGMHIPEPVCATAQAMSWRLRDLLGLGERAVGDFNDTVGKEGVMRRLDESIRRLEIEAGATGPSRRIVVDPIRRTEPAQEPAPERERETEPTPAEPSRQPAEPVPA